MNQNEKEFLVQQIRTQYTEKENNGLDELKDLDKKVKRPANIFAYTFGTISSLIMGTGMSLVMSDIGTMLGLKDSLTLGIVIGVIGMMMVLANYPIYKKILNSRKKKYASQILELSEKLIQE